MTYTNEQIDTAVKALPEEFQDAIADASIGSAALEIGKRHGLHIDQAEKLQNNALLAALDLIDGSKLSETISRDIGIPPEKAEVIVREINEIFQGIRKNVRERMDRETAEKKEEEEMVSEKAPEEEINRDALLKEIETPAPAASVSAPAVENSVPITMLTPPTNLPVGEPAFVPPSTSELPKGLVGEKLALPMVVISKETLAEDHPIASLKKADPYREPIK